ncbi:MAG: glycosyltransferase family 4 protein, partial [Candidatus Sumerlaeia bacterium]|nr:glycosyltransferase family 4 protein [Candidatus Sumerlaeia bacterium]
QHSLFGKKCKRIKHKWYEKILAPFTDRIIAVSRIVKDDYVKFTGISADKIDVIYNGIDLTPFAKTYDVASIKQQLGITGRIIIGSIGRLVGVKNYPTLIKAAHKVSQIVPDIVFIIVGDGECDIRNKLLAQIAELKLENNVKLLGYRTDIPQLIQMFDICVLPSLFEGFPGVILEFMAAQKPIITSSNGGQAEILTPEKNALFFPPENADELANSIIRLINEPKLRQYLAENARLTSVDFSLEKMVANFDRLYKSLLAKKLK